MNQNFTFDTQIERRNQHSDKWNKYPEDVIPMWVADMDFDAPDCVKKALEKRIQHGAFGYTFPSRSLVEAIQSHCQNHYHWQPDSPHFIHLPGLVCALHLCTRALTAADDRIIVPSPVYYHLTKAPEMAARKLDRVPFVLIENRWTVDLAALETSCQKTDAKMILLCNPHNPGATVYRQEELLAIHSLAQQHNLTVVSDEIHCDLILNDARHIPFASLNEDAAQRTITLMSPSKTFNLAGLGYAFAIIANPGLRQSFNKARAALIPAPNLLGLVAAEAAYREGQAWHQALRHYLKRNSDYIRQCIQGTKINMAEHEATYLAWLDIREYNLQDPHKFFVNAGVGVSNGKDFGAEGFLRLNFGCPRVQLESAMKRMLTALATQP